MVSNHPKWNLTNDPKHGFLNFFTDSIIKGLEENPNFLPDIKRGSTIFIGSDYGGEHGSSTHHSMAFLFADIEQCGPWLTIHKEIRNRYLPDGRRVSYKSLGDNLKRQFLIPFLNSANNIPGVIFIILIDKGITGLFDNIDNIRNIPFFKKYSHWKPGVLKKALSANVFVSLFLGGLSRANQDVMWITDEDDIVANEDRLLEFIDIYKYISGHFLNHNLRHFRLGTTRLDSGNRQVEDLVSIPDLTCGVLTELISLYHKQGVQLSKNVILPPPLTFQEKSYNIMNWFADERHPLKRIVFQINKDKIDNRILLTRLRFHSISNY